MSILNQYNIKMFKITINKITLIISIIIQKLKGMI